MQAIFSCPCSLSLANFVIQVGGSNYIFGHFVNIFSHLRTVVSKAHDEPLISGPELQIYLLICCYILWLCIMLTQLFVLQTNELYQLASVAFCLLVAWVCPFLQSYFLRYILAFSVHIMICTTWVRETSLFTLLSKVTYA